MKPGRIAAWTITAIAIPGLAACSASSSGGTTAFVARLGSADFGSSAARILSSGVIKTP